MALAKHTQKVSTATLIARLKKKDVIINKLTQRALKAESKVARLQCIGAKPVRRSSRIPCPHCGKYPIEMKQNDLNELAERPSQNEG